MFNDQQSSTQDLLKQINGYRAFLNRSGDLITHHTFNGIITYISPASLTLIGYGPKELLGKCILDFAHPNDKYLLEQAYCLTKETNETNRFVYRIRRKEGNYIWLESTYLFIDTNELFCVSRDVTSQKIMEEEMKSSQEKYQLLVDNLLDTIGIITSDGIWIYINESGKRLIGTIRKEDIIGKSIFDFVHSNEKDHIRNYMNNSKTDQVNSFIELTLIRHDTRTKKVEIKFIPTIYNEQKTYQVVIQDITDRKRTEEKLQQAEKLSVVGQLAAGIAHEIRNPLTAIKGFSQLVKGDFDTEYFDVILMELERIESIINDLLILAKPQVVNIDQVDISKALESTITFFNSQAILYNCELILDIQLEEQYIEGEADQLKQVLINLLKNSTEAMPEGGKIWISAQLVNDNMIQIQIKDEGIGIPEERIPKLGEPFYSTKEKGTGLGMMICNRIIKNHKGSLHITSKVNKGTTITILLPKTI